MADLPSIPRSALAVLKLAGVESLEDAARWPAAELAALRGVGPKAFQRIESAMRDAGLRFDESSKARAEPINLAMAKERMKDVKPIPEHHTLPPIGRPALRALAQINVLNLEQVALMTRQELMALHGVGPKAVRLLETAMHEQGLGFRDE